MATDYVSTCLQTMDTNRWLKKCSKNDRYGLTELIGELIGVTPPWWLLRGGDTGAHKNGAELLLSSELFELWAVSVGIKVFVSGAVELPFSWWRLRGRSFKLYFKWFGSRGLQKDSSSGWRKPISNITVIIQHFKKFYFFIFFFNYCHKILCNL
jgi:hypothetical protein